MAEGLSSAIGLKALSVSKVVAVRFVLASSVDFKHLDLRLEVGVVGLG